MSVPVINPTTSVMGYLQNHTWEYLPIATNSPTSWAATTLPDGMSINTATGAISGAATTAGLYLVNLTATNGTGPSTPITLTIQIIEDTTAAKPLSFGKSGSEIGIDVGTGAVTVPARFILKEDDDQMLFVTFSKNGQPLDLGTLTELKIALKEFEPDAVIVLGNTFKKLGSSETTIYQLFVHVDSDKLAAELSGYESDTGTFFAAIAEIEWKEPNPDYPTFGPVALRRSSNLFNLFIYRNVTPV